MTIYLFVCAHVSIFDTLCRRVLSQKWQRFGYFGVIVRCSSIHVGLVQKGEKKERMRRKKKE